MAILPIYEYPDPILRQTAAEVVAFDASFQAHIDDLIDTLSAHDHAVGLAATQVGIPWRIFLMRLPDEPIQIFVNPIIEQASRWKVGREGCLSFPQYLANVKRAKKLVLSARDRDGQPTSHTFEGFPAVIVQHELDHLDGTLFIDRIRSISQDLQLRQPATP